MHQQIDHINKFKSENKQKSRFAENRTRVYCLQTPMVEEIMKPEVFRYCAFHLAIYIITRKLHEIAHH